MTESIVLEPFMKSRDGDLYRDHLRIKYQVFVEEQQWHSLADSLGERVAREDEFDEGGLFWLARTHAGEPIGVVRGIPLRAGFPRKELLEHHLEREEVRRMYLDSLCTLNGLAVLPEYRKHQYEVADRGWKGTVAKLLMLAIIRSMQEAGMKGAIATAGGLASTRLCIGLGFIAIDVPEKRPSVHQDLTMVNIGMIFGSPQHVQAQRDARMELLPPSVESEASDLLQYFEAREREVLGDRLLESFFR